MNEPPREGGRDGEVESAAAGGLRRSLADLHVRLRTEGDTPRRRGAAVALGTFIGCIPVFGLHLALCTVLARLLRLSRVLTYLAAHVNNPLTAPFLVYAELGVGHWLLTGRWPPLELDHLREVGALGLGRDLLLGSGVLGIVLGAVFGLAAWTLARRRRPSPFAHLRERAAEPYLGAGVVHWEFVRGKLRWDPVYRGLLEAGLLPRPGRLVDLGCGRGPLLALLAALAESDPGAPRAELVGIEVRRRTAEVARTALGDRATIRHADLADAEIPECRTAVLLDVLHYLPAAAQEDLLRRTATALEPGGLLLLREADAGAGRRFAVTRFAERLRALGRGHLRQRFHYRGGAEWRELAEAAGLQVNARPMSAGTPFGNVLLAAAKPAAPAAGGVDCAPTPENDR